MYLHACSIRACMGVYACVHSYSYVYMHTRMCMHMYMHIHMETNNYRYEYIHTARWVYGILVYICICARIGVRTCVYFSVKVCIHTSMYMYNACICTHQFSSKRISIRGCICIL